ncbi:hypothetical protein AGMMS49593_01040 [Endomicrobiia bacterium]|nr:hypothetical protein AGMMS49593_01040 [Endomicrobiia bacterium]
MHKVVLIRHGESVWNKENKFTGWADVDLSEKGKEEKEKAEAEAEAKRKEDAEAERERAKAETERKRKEDEDAAKAAADASPLIQSLQAEGRPDAEIRGFMQLENESEYLDERLGEIILRTSGDNGHFVYKVNGKNYDDGDQTTNSCGIWAVRRKLRHMRHLGMDGIPENAWYRYSDSQMREFIGAAEGKQLEVSLIVLLQMISGIKEDNAQVRIFDLEACVFRSLLQKNQKDHIYPIYPDDDLASTPKGKWFYKELLCVCAPQHGDDLMTCHRGGKIRGFDYDAWTPHNPNIPSAPEGKYRIYYKKKCKAS